MAATITSLRRLPRQPAGRLPICESHLGKLWLQYKKKPPQPDDVLAGFVAYYWLWGPVALELCEWEAAGCPHVCGR